MYVCISVMCAFMSCTLRLHVRFHVLYATCAPTPWCHACALCMYVHVYMYVYIYTHTHIHTYTLTHTLTHTHARTHTHTHTHTRRTYVYMRSTHDPTRFFATHKVAAILHFHHTDPWIPLIVRTAQLSDPNFTSCLREDNSTKRWLQQLMYAVDPQNQQSWFTWERKISKNTAISWEGNICMPIFSILCM
jgi:hypothetical protein